MKSSRPLDRVALDQHPLPRVTDGDKETKGRILILAGSREVPGAAILAATSAMRAGAGKLRIVTSASVAPQIAVAMPEAMVVALPEDSHGGLAHGALEMIRADAEKADSVVAGPGLTTTENCRRIANVLLDSPCALTLDAALLHHLSPLQQNQLGRSRRPVLLPHSGELASLLDCEEEEVDRDPLPCGLRAAQLYRSIVLVKGVTSHVVTPDGEAWTYDGGSPGLGVSGSGDVLAGIVGGLQARGADPLSALLWSVWLHGEAGAVLARKMGPAGFLAREIPGEIPALLPR